MRVIAVAHVRNEDVRRILNKAECVPGDEFDLEDALAEIYFKNNWAIKAPVTPVEKHNAVEFAATPGAPEHALSGRGRRGKPTDV